MTRRIIIFFACMALCPISIPVQARAQAPLFSQRDKELARLVTGGIGSQEYWQFLVDLEQRRAGAPQKSWTPGMPLFSERDMELAKLTTGGIGSQEYWKFLVDLELQRAGYDYANRVK